MRNSLKPMKKPFAETAKDASGEVKVGESAEAIIASRRWKLFKAPRFRREGILARIANKGRLPAAWFRTITNRRTPKPCSYSNAGAVLG